MLLNFAYSALQTAVGSGNENVILVENSSRFQALSMLKIIQQFGTRSMSFKEIVFPYWENVARGYEDIFAVLFIVKSIVLIVLGSFFFAVIVACWKRKTWTLENGITWMKDALYEKSAQRAKKKQKRAPRKRGGKE